MKYPKYKYVLALCDFLIVRLSLFAATQIRGISHVQVSNLQSYFWAPEFTFFFFFSFIVILIFQYNNLYKINIFLSRSRQVVIIFISLFYSVFALALVEFFIHSKWFINSRLAVAYFAVIAFVSIVLFRLFIFRPLFITLRKMKNLRRNVLIVGTNMAAKNLAIQLQLDNIYGLWLAGFLDYGTPVGTKVFEGFRVLGEVKDIPQIVKSHNISEIIVALSNISHEEMLKILDLCKATTADVKVISPLFEVIHQKIYTEAYFNIPFTRLMGQGAYGPLLPLKRIVDVVLSFVALLALALPFFIVGVIIKVTSKGPVFYKQVRIGKDGKPFMFYKFRSMVVGSDQDESRIKDAHKFIHGENRNGNGSKKVVNKRMVTPIGRFLRKTSLDELPQLFNVLKGDMSLVGPRPCLPYEYEEYDEWHKRRLSVLPGCTGLWQVSSRSEVGFDDMVLLDLYYIENLSPWFDLQLMLKTIPVMITGRGGE